ncbi:MAG TPA: molybdopterin converting factor subunit 1 [Chromatiaceae bacterium]|jgi:molybdopterin synthase sulfur carrier subunit|nr:molybdopterin converting factor subunit 1 [Chromatiaceae bacterium]HIB83180.1 molybdopterin converting factor subunit 1 [Chromatiaceae bacterium]HIN82231.1 molybdopterin converting factor subunit 1 [Chromatiales bacterium]HIO14547.1 molybdopterin converting factor subunit 1 [Chromatiales bacterium]HIO54068.1 molybdopterin converting factor subunit 1 [Chromatiales bacterium]
MVTVKYFASLRERLGRDGDTVSVGTPLTVADLWHQVGAEDIEPSRIMCAINHDYANPSAIVNDGDEVAFFPPVTGG